MEYSAEERAPNAQPDRIVAWRIPNLRDVTPLSYQEIESQDDARTGHPASTSLIAFWAEGIVPGSLVLIGEEIRASKVQPCCFEVADKLSNLGGKYFTFPAKESERQIKLRGERLGIKPANLYLWLKRVLNESFRSSDRLDPHSSGR
jgi:DNA repair protein RadA/Sms